MDHAPRPAPLGTLRAIAFAWMGLLTTFFAWLTTAVAVSLQPRSGWLAAWIGRLWGRAVLFSAGARLVVEGTERFAPGEVRLLVANHCSYLDPPAVLASCPVNLRFVLKRELGRMPFVGWHAHWGGHFLLDRSRPREGREVLARLVARARRHRLVPFIFPEGTRSADGRLAPLRAGSFEVALAGQMPVQPIAILGSAEILPRGANGPKRSGVVRVRVGDPIDTRGLEGGQGRKVVAARVRAALLALGVPEGTAGARRGGRRLRRLIPSRGGEEAGVRARRQWLSAPGRGRRGPPPPRRPPPPRPRGTAGRPPRTPRWGEAPAGGRRTRRSAGT